MDIDREEKIETLYFSTTCQKVVDDHHNPHDQETLKADDTSWIDPATNWASVSCKVHHRIVVVLRESREFVMPHSYGVSLYT